MIPNKQFQPGKRYKFSKEVFLTDAGRVALYKNCEKVRRWVDEVDGKEVSVSPSGFGMIDDAFVSPLWTEEILSSTRAAVRTVANKLYGGKSMKLSEVIAKLEENPKGKFETISRDGYARYEFSVSNGYFRLRIYNRSGELISEEYSGGRFNNNISAGLDWRQVQEPVDFLTAINSG